MTRRALRPRSPPRWPRRRASGGRSTTAPSLRDQVAIAVLLKESGLLPDRLARLLDAMPGADLSPDSLSTQEQAWAAAAAAVLGRDGKPARIAVDGQDQAAGAGVVGGTQRAGDGAEPGRSGGVADDVGDRRAGGGTAGGARRRCGSRGSSSRSTASRSIWIT